MKVLTGFVFSEQDRAAIATFRRLLRKYPQLRLGFNCHSHTEISDGQLSLEELAQLGAECGFRGMGIMDHNAFGLDLMEKSHRRRAQRIREKYGVRLVCGMEVSGQDDFSPFGGYADREVHIGALDLCPCDLPVRRTIEKMQAKRRVRNCETLERIREKGYLVAPWEELAASYPNVTTEIIAQHTRNPDGSPVNPEAFVKKHLRREGDCFVPKEYLLPVEEAIELILRAEGVPELCHPLSTLEGGVFRHFEEIAGRYVGYGLGGIEGFTKYMLAGPHRRILRFCRQKRIRVFGGSDTHEAKDFLIYVRKVNELLN